MGTQAIDYGIRVLADVADRRTIDAEKRLRAEGRGEWIFDFDVPELVVGFVRPGTKTALIVVYVSDNDFETTLEFEEEVAK